MGRGAGGGGLRILPHKSWNVYGYENRRRVAEDEAKHAAEVEAAEAYQRANDAEYRIGVLRQRATKRERDTTNADDAGDESTSASRLTNGLEDADGGVYGADEDATQPPSLKRPRLGATSSAAAAAAAAAAPQAAMRYVVQQEEAAEVDLDAADSNDLTDTPLAAAQHINLFEDVAGSAKAVEMARMKASNQRKQELAAARQYAPVSLFVESLRDPESGVDSLRPWYTASVDERRAHEIRAREANKKRVAVRRNNQTGRVQLVMNPTGETRHDDVADPLEEMQNSLRQLKKYEAAKQAEAAAASSAIPPATPAFTQAFVRVNAFASHPTALARQTSIDPTELTSPPPLETNTPHHRRSRWDEARTAMSSQPPTAMHFTPGVGFTNTTSPATLLPNATFATVPPTPLFASSLTATVRQLMANLSSDSSTSSSDSSDSETSSSSSSGTDDKSDGRKRHRRNRSRTRSRSRSKRRKSHKRESSKKELKKTSKKDKKRDKNAKKSHRHRSRSRSHERHSSSSSSKKKKSRRESRGHSSAVSSHAASFAPNAPSQVAVTTLRSPAELRAEREARERAEREKAAALLRVPVWATTDQRSITQRDMSDDLIERSERPSRGRR